MVASVEVAAVARPAAAVVVISVIGNLIVPSVYNWIELVGMKSRLKLISFIEIEIERIVSPGGNTGHKDSGNGEGGYSYASLKLTDVYFKSAAHYGPGEILIIPAISGCGCDYRCVALDQFLSETKCLCPQGWMLSNDSKSCISEYRTNSEPLSVRYQHHTRCWAHKSTIDKKNERDMLHVKTPTIAN